MTPEAAKEALSLNGQMVCGRPVRLDLSAPKKPGQNGRSPGPRSFGGGRGGRGGPQKPASARATIQEFKGQKVKF